MRAKVKLNNSAPHSSFFFHFNWSVGTEVMKKLPKVGKKVSKSTVIKNYVQVVLRTVA